MNKDNSNNKLNFIVNEFIKKIYELDKSKNTLEEKIKSIDNFLNNLIDYCIKKKIFFYVENKISYTNIVLNFKSHLIKFIKNLIDPFDNIINKYINLNNPNNPNNPNNSNNSNNPNWDNISDINSLMFRNFKKLNETFEKNVSFDDKFQITNYDDDDGFECNIKSLSINENLFEMANTNVNTNVNINIEIEIEKLSLYIKILVNQNKYLIEFIDKLNQMCKILSDPEIKYKKSNPFD